MEAKQLTSAEILELSILNTKLFKGDLFKVFSATGKRLVDKDLWQVVQIEYITADSDD